eukprot:737047-Pyramimonas_sp.AAC.1
MQVMELAYGDGKNGIEEKALEFMLATAREFVRGATQEHCKELKRKWLAVNVRGSEAERSRPSSSAALKRPAAAAQKASCKRPAAAAEKDRDRDPNSGGL